MPTDTKVTEVIGHLATNKDTLAKLASAQLSPLFGENHFGAKAKVVGLTAKEASRTFGVTK